MIWFTCDISGLNNDKKIKYLFTFTEIYSAQERGLGWYQIHGCLKNCMYVQMVNMQLLKTDHQTPYCKVNIILRMRQIWHSTLYLRDAGMPCTYFRSTFFILDHKYGLNSFGKHAWWMLLDNWTLLLIVSARAVKVWMNMQCYYNTKWKHSHWCTYSVDKLDLFTVVNITVRSSRLKVDDSMGINPYNDSHISLSGRKKSK